MYVYPTYTATKSSSSAINKNVCHIMRDGKVGRHLFDFPHLPIIARSFIPNSRSLSHEERGLSFAPVPFLSLLF